MHYCITKPSISISSCMTVYLLHIEQQTELTKQVGHAYFIFSQLRQLLQKVASDDMATSLLCRKLYNFLKPASDCRWRCQLNNFAKSVTAERRVAKTNHSVDGRAAVSACSVAPALCVDVVSSRV